MSNHYHPLLEVGSVPLSWIMQGPQFGYACYLNRHYGDGAEVIRYIQLIIDFNRITLSTTWFLLDNDSNLN